jgi:hypothetical protein
MSLEPLGSIELTPLEYALLASFHDRYRQQHFPAAGAFKVAKRENTDAGRFTYLEHDGKLDRPDGQLDLGRFSQINMDGLEAGASFWLQIEHGKVAYLEIIVNGDGGWPGQEGAWVICDPDTGEFPA